MAEQLLPTRQGLPLQSDSSETSGYSSTSVSDYSSFRPGSRHSLSRRRDSLALSHDEGRTITNIVINVCYGILNFKRYDTNHNLCIEPGVETDS